MKLKMPNISMPQASRSNMVTFGILAAVGITTYAGRNYLHVLNPMPYLRGLGEWSGLLKKNAIENTARNDDQFAHDDNKQSSVDKNGVTVVHNDAPEVEKKDEKSKDVNATTEQQEFSADDEALMQQNANTK